MLDFLNSTLGIICSVLTILTIIGVPTFLINKNKTKRKDKVNDGNGITNIGDGKPQIALDNPGSVQNDIKNTAQILFIDDEDFNVIKMLRKAGWKNIKRIPDFANLDIIDLKNANVVFVDIKGVGIVGGYKNEGIGLAAAIKKKYPNKGVILYSGTLEYNIFDPDIDIVDAKLQKNAEPIQFSYLIEQYGATQN